MALDDQDQRTLPPTQKRIDDFRKRGEVARSRDLTAAATLTGGAIGLMSGSSRSAQALAELLQVTLRGAGTAMTTTEAAGHAVRAFTTAASPTVIGALVGCVVVGVAQLGAPPVLSFPKLDFSRLFNPATIASLLSPKALAGRAGLAIAKVSVVLIAALLAVHGAMTLFGLRFAGAAAVATALSSLVRKVGGQALVALVLLGVVEYVVTRSSLMKRMRMTPEEYKREHRDSEGDPQVRRRRKQRMRELAKRRLAKAVATADVVLVNPTEYAVALRYRSGEDRAPRVVAKGRGVIAERIRELARAASIPIVAQPPLTRLIHKLVKEGREIPGTLYQAVAEILAYVYRLRRPSAEAAR